MPFLAMGFPVYFAGLLLIFRAVPRPWRRWVLLLGSWLFYLRSGPEALGTLLTVTALAALGARFPRCRSAAALGMLGLLLLFKLRLTLRDLALPLGLSFYTFSCLGLLWDLAPGERGPGASRVAGFAAFFPQMVQGPIGSFSRLDPQLAAPGNLALGALRMLWGYFKKCVAADRLAPATLALLEMEGGPAFWLLATLYGLQIYADFTGGMDIALGAARCFGITLPENFRQPFFSTSVAEFWRRWHITLGEWMKKYVFYPLCVSQPLTRLAGRLRRKRPRLARKLPVYIATLATWLATGLWHGLSPNFWLWGLINGGVILLSQELEPLYRRLRRPWMQGRVFTALRMVRTFTLMNLVRLLDLYPNPGTWFRRMGRLFAWEALDWTGLGLTPLDLGILVFSFAAMAAVSLLQLRRGSLLEGLARRPGLAALLAGALLVAVLLLGCYGIGYEGGNFIYDQF